MSILGLARTAETGSPPPDNRRVVTGPFPRPARRGFTLVEMLVVVFLMSIVLGAATLSAQGYRQRAASRRAAQVFARDLALARGTSVRLREPVVVRFDEANRSYVVESGSGRELARRRFGAGAEVYLDFIDLDFAGDSVPFSAGGVADLSGSPSSLGEAFFAAGHHNYVVSFNALGAARVEAN